MFPKPRAGRLHLHTVRVVLALIVCCGAPRAASADWLITPFIGVKFRADTTLLDLDQSQEQTSTTLGGSVMLLGEGPFGVEADFGYSPGFFGSKSELVTSSRVITLMGNVVIATPISVTRESLRPFFVAGAGLMDARLRTTIGIFDEKLANPAISLGGGALGRLSDGIQLRFEIRRFQYLTAQGATGIAFGTTRLTFWRADIGLAFRY